jgi:predicted dehydrogenase
MESVCGNVIAIVEPWFLGEGAGSPGSDKFLEFKTTLEGAGTRFYADVFEVGPVPNPTVAFVAERTEYNPDDFRAALSIGVSHVYLEKPGADSANDLAEMEAAAKKAGVQVFMGYSTTVARYVAEARQFELATPGALTTFIHTQSYSPDDLAECFSTHREGMLWSMALHELAVAVMYYGLSVATINEVNVNNEATTLLTLDGITDFSRLDFTVRTTAGRRIRIVTDRCGDHPGGPGSKEAIVSVDDRDLFRAVSAPVAVEAALEEQLRANPTYKKYFILQAEQYRKLKELTLLSAAAGKPAAGVATIATAVEILRVAEFLQKRIDMAVASFTNVDLPVPFAP